MTGPAGLPVRRGHSCREGGVSGSLHKELGWGGTSEGIRPPSQPLQARRRAGQVLLGGVGWGLLLGQSAETLCLEHSVGAAQLTSLFLPTLRDAGTGQGVQFLTPFSGIRAPPGPPWRWRNFPARHGWTGRGPGLG